MKDAASKAGGQIASVIHLAAYYDTTGDDNSKYEAVMVQGTRRLLTALKAVGTEQLVFSSTLQVHAPSSEKGVRIDEDSPLDPPWAYPRSKVETEELIAKERGGIKTVILRLAGVYDEDCRAALIAQQISTVSIPSIGCFGFLTSRPMIWYRLRRPFAMTSPRNPELPVMRKAVPRLR